MDIGDFEKIQALPRWAAVAFATRCARRVLPLLKRDWDIPPDLVQIVRFELRHAETAAGLARDLPVHSEALATCQRVLDAASVAERSGSLVGPLVGRAVAEAFDLALASSGVSLPDPRPIIAPEQAMVLAWKAARNLEAQGMLSGVEDFVLTAMRTDLELLEEASRQKAWTHGTPVPGVFFTPLFQEHYPEWLCDEKTELGLDEKRLSEEASRLFDLALSKKGSWQLSDEVAAGFEKSASAFRLLIDGFRERPSYLFNCGVSILELADIDKDEHRIESKEQRALEALQWFARAIEVTDFAPEHGVVPASAASLSKYHHSLGQAARHLGRQDEGASLAWRMLALAEYERALALDPNNKAAQHSIDDEVGGILRVLPKPLPLPPYELMIIGPPWGA